MSEKHMAQSKRPLRRVLLVLVSVIALLAGGVPAAQAATPGTISGKLAIPAGVSPDDFDVDAFAQNASGGWLWVTGATPAADGSFSLSGLTDGTDYLIRVFSDNDDWAGGVYAGPGKMGRALDDGSPVTAPLDGVQLTVSRTKDLTVSYTLPAGFQWHLLWDPSPRPLYIYAHEYGPDGAGTRGENRYVKVTPESGGTVTIRGLRTDAAYRVQVYDGNGSYPRRFPPGFYRQGASAQVKEQEFASLVRGGDSIRVPIAYTVAEPTPIALTVPQLSGTAKVGSTLAVSTGSWAPAETALTISWLRDGAVIPGASSSSYKLTAADAGFTVAARVSASAPGYATTASTTAGKLVQLAPSKKARTSGVARFGSKLKALAPSWGASGVRTTYQWLRDGKVITGASSSRYTLTKKDLGKRISVRATGLVGGKKAGTSTSAATKKVAKGKAKVTASAKTVSVGKRATVKVKVKIAGLSRPLGTVTVKVGKRSVSAKLTSKRKGAVSVRLPALAKGKHKLKVTFKPSGSSKKLLVSSSGKATLRVR